MFYLQSDGKADQVDDHLLVGELNGQDGERGKEQLVVFVDVVFLFTAQVDVAVELLTMLKEEEEEEKENFYCQRSQKTKWFTGGHKTTENLLTEKN